jgi:hypothetical protein
VLNAAAVLILVIALCHLRRRFRAENAETDD